MESVGEGVADLAPGDHVLPVFTGECKRRVICVISSGSILIEE